MGVGRWTPLTHARRGLHTEAYVLAVAGEIDLVTEPQVRSALDAALRTEPAILIVDLTAVEFLGSTGLTALVAAHHGATTTQLRVVTNPAARRIMQITGLDTVLPLFATLDLALDAN
ncbi:STAS domain-containing protein [Actinokineospora sp. HUAS TT18]|uniref:STAS domain-containing protein n=1 Tax=Actinokineospora sp. HUAS TT18 TaxID=3447451 RepID=UPI003F520272